MSAHRYVTVWCDETADSALMSCGNYVEGDSAADARRTAKRLGWVVGVPKRYPGDMPRDYCPRHKARNPKPDDSGSPGR